MNLQFRILMPLLILLLLARPCLAIDKEHELPFGVNGLGADYSGAQLNRLGNLGFNYASEYTLDLDSVNVDSLYNHGMESARGGLGWSVQYPTEAPFKYSMANYAVIDVDPPDSNPEVRMVSFGDSTYFDNGCWVSPQGYRNTLTGVSTYGGPRFQSDPLKNCVYFEAKYFFHFFGDSLSDYRIPYHLRLHARINNPVASPDSVAYVYVNLGQKPGNWTDQPCSLYTCATFRININDFHGDTLQDLELGIFTIPDEIEVKQGCYDDTTITFPVDDKGHVPYLNLEIVSTGVREIAIDRVTIYDPAGQELIERGAHDNVIRQKFQDYYSDRTKLFAWALYDEPMLTNFLPMQHIKDIMKSVYTAPH
jgi:hypothetical protein